MPMLFYLWLAMAVLFATLELGHPGMLYFLSFAIGAAGASLGAAGSAIFGWFSPNDFVMQQIIFLVVTILAFYVLRKAAGGWIADMHTKAHRTNVDALIGQRGVVVESITLDAPGRVRVGNEVWRARVATPENIEEGQSVFVTAVRGSHVVVKLAD